MEKVNKFDLEAAFKALDEIEQPKLEKGEGKLKANRVDLRERFGQKSGMDKLVEDYYDLTSGEDLEEAQDDREAEVAQAKLARIEKIVDLDADSPDDLLPSYIGKVIMQCPQCMTLFYKNPEDIEHSEENPDVVNINEICQHCGNSSGYTLIGKVGTVEEDEMDNYQAAEEAPAEEHELDLDFDQPTEEVDAEGTGEAASGDNEETKEGEDLDLDLDLDLGEEEEEKKEESLHHSEAERDAEKGSELFTDNKSDKLTLNEDAGSSKIIVKAGDITKTYDSVEDAIAAVDNWYQNCADEDFAENVLYALLCDLRDEEEEMYDVDENGNRVYCRESINNSKVQKDAEGLNEGAEKLIGIIDLSGSQGNLKEPYTKIAKENGATEIVIAQDPEFKEVENSCKNGKCILITCDDDIEHNRPDLLDNSNLRVIKVDRPKTDESLNNSEAQKDAEKGSELKTKNGSENLTLNEGVGDEIDAIIASWGTNESLEEDSGAKNQGSVKEESDLDRLLDSEEFQTPVTEKEIEAARKLAQKGKEEKPVEEELDFDEGSIDDLDECSLNKHVDEYLKEVYSNVKSYETVDCSLKEGKLIVEGKITFNSGKCKPTTFEFSPARADGKLFFEGVNKDFSECKAFKLNCSVDKSKKLITESLGYSYKINEALVEGLK